MSEPLSPDGPVGATPVPASERHVRRAATAAGWLAVARGLGVGWRVLVVWQLGFVQFGRYAVVIAAAAVLAAMLDSYFVVRGPRVDDGEFRVDRATRWWLGGTTCLAGALVVVTAPAWGLAALVLVKAGGDVAFNATVAPAVRAGRPDRVYGLDALRQACSVAAAAGWLLLRDAPSIGEVTTVYVLTSLAFALPGWRAVRGVRPAVLEHPARARINVAEAVGAAVYVNGDVVALGVLAGTKAAGQYSFGVVAVWLIGLVAQNYVVTFHEPLRARNGAAEAGPRPRHTAVLSGMAGGAMLAGCAVLYLTGADRGLWLSFGVLSVVGLTRVWAAVCATILTIQRRDRLRLVLTVVGVALKAAALLALAVWGAVGGALAFLVADVVVTAAAVRAVYGRRP